LLNVDIVRYLNIAYKKSTKVIMGDQPRRAEMQIGEYLTIIQVHCHINSNWV